MKINMVFMANVIVGLLLGMLLPCAPNLEIDAGTLIQKTVAAHG